MQTLGNLTVSKRTLSCASNEDYSYMPLHYGMCTLNIHCSENLYVPQEQECITKVTKKAKGMRRYIPNDSSYLA